MCTKQLEQMEKSSHRRCTEQLEQQTESHVTVSYEHKHLEQQMESRLTVSYGTSRTTDRKWPHRFTCPPKQQIEVASRFRMCTKTARIMYNRPLMCFIPVARPLRDYRHVSSSIIYSWPHINLISTQKPPSRDDSFPDSKTALGRDYSTCHFG
jgi:hypothetical protein